MHDVGHQDGIHFLVMELVDGETLAERVQSGPLPIAETLAIAHQIAGALEAAHETGILHRDLKPANIKITPDGTVKVRDFGLAKALDGTPAGARLSDSPTLSRLATQAGMVMGTASYMSPEQARGKPVDRRTDVWAFGCVLYEMLTAKRAFDGETITDILGAIVHKEPDWSGLPVEANPRLHELLRRCLQKDVKQRLRDMGDVQLEIDAVRSAPGPRLAPSDAADARVASLPRWRVVLPWVVAAGMAMVSAIAATAWWRVVSQRQAVTRLTVEISPSAPLSPSWGEAAVLSPDGSQLVYVAGTTSNRQLYVRRLDQLGDTLLPGTTGAISPFFSPDGQSVGFFAPPSLKKVSLGGKWQISRGGGQMPRWSRDGRELVYRVPNQQLMSVGVNITAGRSFQHEAPQPLFQDVFAVRPLNSTYDFAPDGKRFVTLQDDSGVSAAMTHVTLVFNWFEDLKARLSRRHDPT